MIISNAFGENISRNATTHNIVFPVDTCVYLYTTDINHGLIHPYHIMPNAYKLWELVKVTFCKKFQSKVSCKDNVSSVHKENQDMHWVIG